MFPADPIPDRGVAQSESGPGAQSCGSARTRPEQRAEQEHCAPGAPTEVVYNYVLRQADGSLIQDWGNDRVFDPTGFKEEEEVLIIDAWNSPAFYENAFYTEPFKQVLLRPKFTEARAIAPERVTHAFRVKAPLLEKGQTLCLLGSSALLGKWNTGAPRLLNRLPGEDYLSLQLDLSGETFPLEYKIRGL